MKWGLGNVLSADAKLALEYSSFFQVLIPATFPLVLTASTAQLEIL